MEALNFSSRLTSQCAETSVSQEHTAPSHETDFSIGQPDLFLHFSVAVGYVTGVPSA